MLSTLKYKINSARQILKTEGLTSLLKRIGSFTKWKCFVCITHYLYEKTAEDFQTENEADYTPKINNFTIKFVSSNDEADKLEAEGFEFRSQDVKSRYYLDNGALASCIFIGNELGHLGWSEMTKQLTDTDIMKVDCTNNEVHGAWTWTNPKYRRLGLQRYGGFKRQQFAYGKGKTVFKYSVGKSNISSQAAQPKTARKYAEVRYLKILGWKYIKTKYV